MALRVLLGAVFPDADGDRLCPDRLRVSYHVADRPPVRRAWPCRGCAHRYADRTDAGLLGCDKSIPAMGRVRPRDRTRAGHLRRVRPRRDRGARSDAPSRRSCRGRSSGAPTVGTTPILRRLKIALRVRIIPFLESGVAHLQTFLPIVDAKNPIGLSIVELAAFRLVASSDHGQPYNNVAQIPSSRRSKSSGDAGRDHRAPSSTDRAAANSKDKPARPRSS